MSISLTDNNKIFGSEPRSYEYNRFPDKYTRYRFYSSEKRPLSIKTQNLIKNEYCSQCGTLISNVDNLHECFACKKPLCLSCNNAGLCVSHFQQLDKDDQQTLKKHSKRKQKSFISFFFWGFFGIPLILGGTLGGALTSNWILLGLSIPGGIFLLVGLPFVLAKLYKNKERSAKKNIIPILKKIDKSFAKPVGSSFSPTPSSEISNAPRFNLKNASVPEKPVPSEREKALLETFKKLLKISNKVKQEHVASLLEISENQLRKKLLEWGEFLPFKIDGELIVVDDMDRFVKQIDMQFEDWQQKENGKIGKS